MRLKPYSAHTDDDLRAAKTWLSDYMEAQSKNGAVAYIHRFSNGDMQLNYNIPGVGVVTTCASGPSEVEVCNAIDKNWRRKSLAKEAK